ncbi:diguanylate cyclase [Undibacterium sp. CY7W]|uniref:Diguanylate cyclase n=1 Tax=Undibacterium rugosum TaxID=2762291 RepID=A0A923I2K8_9BURK|nr:ABC transporter substrate-binding protein [Undibacterium rugosum]MBC3936638.1 diguanylate cyclase [Undibacterium rugosum]
MSLKFRVLLCFLCIASQLSPMLSRDAHALEKVALQLKWTHAFQFAGYYAAQQQGYYQQAGLEVDVREVNPQASGFSVIDEVVSGRAQFGVGTSSLLLERKAGKPVVALAVIFQHSPQILVARKKSDLQTVHDLSGKRLMLEPQSDELIAYLRSIGMADASMKTVGHSFSTQDFIEGKVDVMSAYVTNEPFYLNQSHVDYQIYTPRSVGIDFYGDNLFTTEQEIKQHPERVQAFREASLRGWEYAMAHPAEIIALILRNYPQRFASPQAQAALQFEAQQMQALLRTDLVAIGYMHPGRWRHIAETYASIGMLPEGYTSDGFLYQVPQERNNQLVYVWISLTLLIAVAIATLALYIYRVNRRLAKSMQEFKDQSLRLKLLSMAVENSPASVLITGPDTRIEYVNPQFSKETGYSADEVFGKTPKLLQSGMTSPHTYASMWANLNQGKLWSGELINRRKSGQIYWEEALIAPVRNQQGETTHFVAVKRDITERKRVDEKLAHMAHHDSLTNLPNRVLFFERVQYGLVLARRQQSQLALMFIDLDRFKPINDNYGHAVGDAILQEAARRMSELLRESDTIGRIGGDEFVGLMMDVGSVAIAEQLATKICHALSLPFDFAGVQHEITASIGVALYPYHGEDERSLSRAADIAMYHAKAGGRNAVRVFETHMKDNYLLADTETRILPVASPQ